jgi:hypothetical protein
MGHLKLNVSIIALITLILSPVAEAQSSQPTAVVYSIRATTSADISSPTDKVNCLVVMITASTYAPDGVYFGCETSPGARLIAINTSREANQVMQNHDISPRLEIVGDVFIDLFLAKAYSFKELVDLPFAHANFIKDLITKNEILASNQPNGLLIESSAKAQLGRAVKALSKLVTETKSSIPKTEVELLVGRNAQKIGQLGRGSINSVKTLTLEANSDGTFFMRFIEDVVDGFGELIERSELRRWEISYEQALVVAKKLAERLGKPFDWF